MINYDWDTWMQFFQEHWFVLLIALVLLFIVIRVLKTVIKWAIAAVIVIAIVVYSGYNLEDLKSNFEDLKAKGAQMGAQVADSVKQEALKAMAGEAAEATYTQNEDGSFTIRTKNLELRGKQGENEVSVSFHGAPLGNWKIDQTIQGLIDRAKSNN